MAQSPSISDEQVREFVLAAHGDLGKVQEMIGVAPQLLNRAHPWSDTDRETPIQAAAHVGNVAIANFLIGRGAPLEICTVAMLGNKELLYRLIDEDPSQINAVGAHGIPLLTHAALSGDVALVEGLLQRGAAAGASAALNMAARRGWVDLARVLIERAGADPSWKDFQGKTALAIADERGDAAMLETLGRAEMGDSGPA